MLSIGQWNTSNIYAGAEIRYGYKNVFSFSATGVYRNWDAKDDSQSNAGAYALVYKPAFEADLHIDVHPVSALLLNLGYRHIRARRWKETKSMRSTTSMPAAATSSLKAYPFTPA